MDNNINIINSKENVLDLEIEIEGMDTIDQSCKFVIQTKEVDFTFNCENTTGNNWTVKIPAMPQIESTLYNFYIYMVVDGYYFEPYKGTLNVTKSNEVYVKDITNKTFNPTTIESVKKEPVPPSGTIKHETPKPYNDLNEKFSSTLNKFKEKIKPKSDEQIIKEQKIHDILNDSSNKKKSKSSVKISKGKKIEI